MINDDRINELLELLARDGSLDERLLLVDSLTRLPLSDQAWRRAAAPLSECLTDFLESRKQPEEFLRVFARVPLMSVRASLRGITRKPSSGLAAASAMALASQHDADALPFLLEELARNPAETVAQAIACLPWEILSNAAAQLRDALRAPDPMVRLWVSIALAKGYRIGDPFPDLEPLEQLWDSLVREPHTGGSREPLFAGPPPLFWGDPWRAESQLAETRPLSEVARKFLLDLRQNDYQDWEPRSAETLEARNAKVLLAGLTGEFDIYGEPRTREGATETPASDTASESTPLIAKWLHASSPTSWLPEIPPNSRSVPSEMAAAAVERALATLPMRNTDQDPAASHAQGNQLVEFVSSLPASLPLRIAAVVDKLPTESAVPDDVLAWVLARGGPENLWESLAPSVVWRTGFDRRVSLQWLQKISSQLDAPAPYKGAGGDAGTESQVQLIDDMPQGSTRGRLGGSHRAKPPLPPQMAPPPDMAPPPQAGPPLQPSPIPMPQPAPQAAPESAGAEPPEETVAVPRYIQGVLSELDGTLWRKLNHTTLLLDEPHKLAVTIGPRSAGVISANIPFPDAKLDWQHHEMLRLEVVFAILDGRKEAHVAQITLRRTGTSEEALFFFSLTLPGLTRMRIAVMHEGRIVQTAILSAFAVQSRQDVTGTPEPEPEMSIHTDLAALEGRRSFDASLLLNENPLGQHTAMAAAGGEAYIASLDESQGALADISALLQDIATQSKDHTRKLRSDLNANWLVKLAQFGHSIHGNLVGDYVGASPAADKLRNARYLQIVTAKPDAIVPLEFAYEYEFPNDDALLCDGAEEALAKRACPATCKLKQDPAGHVCPMGFWGLSRVIERHAYDPAISKAAIITGDESNPIKGRIALRGGSLLAASSQVTDDRVESLRKKLAELSGGEVAQFSAWTAWKTWMKEAGKRPNLFVVLPHTQGAGATIELEIGGFPLRSGSFNADYIYPAGSTGSQPIVLLLGCNTAGVADRNSYAHHITAFRRANAAIVLATTAEVVWGDDIARVAGILAEHLYAVAKDSDAHFGDILRDAKCDAVLQSQLVAICLAGVGDADWRITQ